MSIFNRRKLATKRGFKYQYGKSPIFRKNGPTSFHTKHTKKSFSFNFSKLSNLFPKRFKKIFTLTIVLALLVFFIYLTAFSNYFLVKTIKVATDTKSNIPEVSNQISNDLKIYVGRNIFWINKDEITTKINKNFPEIQNVDISRTWPSTINITFSEFPIVANINNSTTNGGAKKYLISSVGYVVKENMEDKTLPYITIKTEEPLNTAGNIIETDKLKYILDAIAHFKEKFGMKTVGAEYKVIAREVHLRTEKNFVIWLDIQKPFEEQFKKLKKALVKLDIFKTPLEYIDLRITGESGEKIIYKRRK